MTGVITAVVTLKQQGSEVSANNLLLRPAVRLFICAV